MNWHIVNREVSIKYCNDGFKFIPERVDLQGIAIPPVPVRTVNFRIYFWLCFSLMVREEVLS